MNRMKSLITVEGTKYIKFDGTVTNVETVNAIIDDAADQAAAAELATEEDRTWAGKVWKSITITGGNE